jgi:hypothetical protein
VTDEKFDPTPAKDTPLVEPETSHVPPGGPEPVDTERILRNTSSIATPDSERQPITGHDSDGQSATTAPETTEADTKVSWNILAIFSLVLGFALSPLAALFGYIALGQIRRSGQQGGNVALAAIVLGWAWLAVFTVLGIVLGTIWSQL